MNPFETFGKDSDPESAIQKIIKNAFGNPIALDAAPTTTGGQLPNDGNSGYYGTNLYINLGGTVYRFSGTAV